MGVKLGGNNQSERVLELLQQKVEAEGQAAIAARKAQTIREMVPRIQAESVAREKADVARQLKQEIEKRKEKAAKQQEGESGGGNPLEGISTVNPVNGDASKNPLSIYNVQQGRSKTGPGGTLTGKGPVGQGLGSQAFNVPSQLTSTETTVRGGDLGQRGALIRQGPQVTQRTLTRPNAMTPADAISLQQQAQYQNASLQQNQEQFDFTKEVERKKLTLYERAQNAEARLANNRDRREQEDWDRRVFLDNRTFSEQFRLDHPEVDAEVRSGIEQAYARNDYATITRLTKDLGEGVSTKLKRQLAERQLDRIDGQIALDKAKANEANSKAGIFINQQATEPDFLTGAGITAQDRRDANDPVSTRHLNTQVQSFTKNAFPNGEFDPAFQAPLESIQQRWFARGQLVLIGKEPGFFGDANTGMASMQPAAEKMLIYLAGSDPENPFKDKITAKEVAEAENYLISIGLAERDGKKLVPTPHNELPWNMLVQGAHHVYGYSKANVQVNGKGQLPPPEAGEEPPKPIDKEAGVPLSGKEQAEKWKSQIEEIDGLLANQSLLDTNETLELMKKKAQLRRNLRQSLDQVVMDAFTNKVDTVTKQRAAAKSKAQEILSRGQ